MNKGIVTYIVNVGSLPSSKAEAFCDRLIDKLKGSKPGSDWDFVVVPVRSPDRTRVEIYFRDEEGDLEKIKPYVVKGLKTTRILELEAKLADAEERNFDLEEMMIGWIPPVSLPSSISIPPSVRGPICKPDISIKKPSV